MGKCVVMKKNGFVSTTLIYTFFILFLALMIFLLGSYSHNRHLLSSYRSDIKISLLERSGQDVNVYFMIYNDVTEGYDLRKNVPNSNYAMVESISSCNNGATIKYENGKYKISAAKTDDCYLFFKPKSLIEVQNED